jgi:hypothetical protein
LFIFCCCLCCLVLVLLHCSQIVCRGLFLFFIFVETCFVQDMICFGESSMGCWRMYIVLLQDGTLCRYLSVILYLWCHLVLRFLYWVFCLGDQSIVDRGIKVSPYHCIEVYMQFYVL